MFTSLVVALDLEAGGDRALPVVHALAGLADVVVELVTVSSPLVADDIDSFELSRRATAGGWPAHSYSVLHGDDIARVIVDHVRGREGAMLVMATSAKRPLVGRIGGSVSTRVLALTDRPVLLVGPLVPRRQRMTRPTLVVGIGPKEQSTAAVPTIASWTQTFPGDDPWVVEVVATDAGPLDESRDPAATHVRRYVELLAGAGVRASARVLHGGEPGFWMEDFADQVDDPILVATSSRWTDDQRHWHSSTRELVRHSTHPVLVVPATGGAELPPPTPDLQPAATVGDLAGMADHPAGVEELPAATCWELVRTRRVGRLAVTVEGRARIFPINFVVDGETIVFRTAPGTKLSGARRADVEFEVDHYDATTGRAWSVIVAGRSSEVTRSEDWEHVHDLLLFPWHLAPKPFFVRIVPDVVSGRRFRAVYAGQDDDDITPAAPHEETTTS